MYSTFIWDCKNWLPFPVKRNLRKSIQSLQILSAYDAGVKMVKVCPIDTVFSSVFWGCKYGLGKSFSLWWSIVGLSCFSIGWYAVYFSYPKAFSSHLNGCFPRRNHWLVTLYYCPKTNGLHIESNYKCIVWKKLNLSACLKLQIKDIFQKVRHLKKEKNSIWNLILDLKGSEQNCTLNSQYCW